MSADDLHYAQELLAWARSLEDHGLMLEEWLESHKRGGDSRPPQITIQKAA